MFIILQNSWEQSPLTSQHKLTPAHRYLYNTRAATLLEVINSSPVITNERECTITIFIFSTVDFSHFSNNFPKTDLSRMISWSQKKDSPRNMFMCYYWNNKIAGTLYNHDCWECIFVTLSSSHVYDKRLMGNFCWGRWQFHIPSEVQSFCCKRGDQNTVTSTSISGRMELTYFFCPPH